MRSPCLRSEQAGLNKWEKHATYSDSNPNLAEKFKKAAERDDERAKNAEKRMEYHQDELTKKEAELKEVMATLEKEQAEADRRGSMAGCSDGEIDDEEEESEAEVEAVLSGRRALDVPARDRRARGLPESRRAFQPLWVSL